MNNLIEKFAQDLEKLLVDLVKEEVIIKQYQLKLIIAGWLALNEAKLVSNKG